MKAHEKALEFKTMYYILPKFQQVLHILQVDYPDGIQMSYLWRVAAYITNFNRLGVITWKKKDQSQSSVNAEISNTKLNW